MMNRLIFKNAENNSPKMELLHFTSLFPSFSSFFRAPFDGTFLNKTEKRDVTGAAIERSAGNSCSKGLRNGEGWLVKIFEKFLKITVNSKQLFS